MNAFDRCGNGARLSALLAFSFCLLASACGGGGSSSKPPAGTAGSPADPPAQTPAPTPPTVPAPDPGTPVNPGMPQTPPPTAPVTPGIAAVTLPIELLNDGAAAQVVDTTLNLRAGDVAQAATLAFTCHRCAFMGAPEWEKTSRTPTTIKASVRVLGNVAGDAERQVPWIDITNDTVKLPAAERLQGGIGVNGLYTIRLQLALDAATRARLTDSAAGNRIQFRFNGTDGESNGLRIIKLNLQDASGRDLAINPMQQADVKPEKDKQHARADIEAGDALWHQGGVLRKSSIVDRRLNASCASCHASEGRDLQYFNYSDNAIVQRGRFHGLSEQQAQQIVAYVRSANRDSVRHVPQAAPWNPPYQPGPGLDSRDVREWAAGAGLDMVLDTPESTLNALFGADPFGPQVVVTQAMMNRLMDAQGVHNARETAISLQFPDWNAWLPAIAPEDVWPDSKAGGNSDFKGSFNQGAAFSGDNRELSSFKQPKQKMDQLDAWLTRNQGSVWGDWSHLTDRQRSEVAGMMNILGWEGTRFVGGGRSNKIKPDGEGKWGGQVGADNMMALRDDAAATRNPMGTNYASFVERAYLAVANWEIVKQWDLVQRYGLEGDQRWFVRDYGSTSDRFIGRGEQRGWAIGTNGLFPVGPHLANTDANNQLYGLYQWEDPASLVGSTYRTNIWYDLAMVVTPQGSIDWPYHTLYTSRLTAQVLEQGGAEAIDLAMTHQLRQLQIRAKEGQMLMDKRKPIGEMSTNLLQFIPATWVMEMSPGWRSGFQNLDGLQKGFYPLMVGGAIQMFNTSLGLHSGRSPNDWKRCRTDGSGGEDYDPYGGRRFCLDPVRPAELKIDANGEYLIQWNRATTFELLSFSALKAGQLGADPRTVSDLQTWIDQAWPKDGSNAAR